MNIPTQLAAPISPAIITNVFGMEFRADGRIRIKNRAWADSPINGHANLRIEAGKTVSITFRANHDYLAGGVMVAPLNWHTKCKGATLTILGDVNDSLSRIDTSRVSLSQTDRIEEATVELSHSSVGISEVRVKTNNISTNADNEIANSFQLPNFDPATDSPLIRVGVYFLRFGNVMNSYSPSTAPEIIVPVGNIQRESDGQNLTGNPFEVMLG